MALTERQTKKRVVRLFDVGRLKDKKKEEMVVLYLEESPQPTSDLSHLL